MAVTIIPHLTFHGDCEEAIHTYIAAFGGEVHYLSRWTAETCERTPEQAGRVMHAEFTLGATRMAASDGYDTPAGNTAVKMMIHMDDMAAARHAVALLAEGGEAISPLKPHPAPRRRWLRLGDPRQVRLYLDHHLPQS